jgi:large subunit ribosomal protein L23
MEILKKPIVTEKMTKKGETLNQYGFVVDLNADKIQIKNAVESFYNVQVVGVNTMKVAGKRKVRYTKAGVMEGNTGTYKKAMVTLKEGQIIDFYSNI